MNCELLYERLTEHREGTLDSDMCTAIERHLVECSPCDALRQDLEELARMCREAKAQHAATMPEAVRRRIEGLLDTEPS